MNLFYICAILFATVQGEILFHRHGLPTQSSPRTRDVLPLWGSIDQKQDHFDPFNSNTFKLRYMENAEFYQTGGPIFIMLGGEWTIDETWLMTGQLYDMALIHNAYMYYVEHRYYGESYPTRDLSSHNLRFLTVDQALADVAHFIIKIKQLNPVIANSKVVVFGGSYAGSLATWLRRKYPHLVFAAVSSSAPLLAKVDFKEYHDIVREKLGTSCASVVTKGVEEIVRILSVGNVEKIKKDFNLCNLINIQDLNEVQYFFVHIASKIGDLIQYATNGTILQMCNALQNPIWLSDYDRLSKFMSNEIDCYGNYEHLKRSLSNTSLHSGNNRQWKYQQCTEFGFFQTSSSTTSLYSRTISIDLYHKWCQDFFGKSFTSRVTNKGVAVTNKKYGALAPNVTRVVSTHGTTDPWHVVGLSKDLNPFAPVILINGSSHCADLISTNALESYEMINAKLAVRKYVGDWLQLSW